MPASHCLIFVCQIVSFTIEEFNINSYVKLDKLQTFTRHDARRQLWSEFSLVISSKCRTLLNPVNIHTVHHVSA